MKTRPAVTRNAPTQSTRLFHEPQNDRKPVIFLQNAHLSGSVYGTSGSMEMKPPRQHAALSPARNQKVERQLCLVERSAYVKLDPTRNGLTR